MSPPSATNSNGSIPNDTVPLEPGLSREKAKGTMAKFPAPPSFTDKHEERQYLKGRLAAAFRIFGKYGFDEGVAGHLSLRDPVEPDKYWVNPFGLAFSLINASDLILVDHTGKVVDGGPNRLLNTAAFMIHSAIHNARPDVVCAAHSHSIYGRTFCSLGVPLPIATQDACAFHDDIALYSTFNGIVLAEEEGRGIAECLGNKKAALLQNHGLLTVGKSVEEAVFWFVSLEKCCHSSLLGMAAGKVVEIGDEEADFTKKTIGSTAAGWFSAKPMFDVIAKETKEEYLA